MNKCQLLGRLTKDIELKHTNSNTAYCNFTLAVNRRFSKEGQQEADFINCQSWGKTAETLVKYVGKGRQIAASGRIQTRNWDDNEGKRHFATEIVVEEFYFADSKKGESTESFPDDDGELPF